MCGKKLNISILFLLMMVLGIRAQEKTDVKTDSVILESQQVNDENYYKLKYEMLDLFLRDETRLFKLAVSPFKPNEKYDFSIILSQLAYERKFSKTWSGVAELNQELMLLSKGTILLNNFDLGLRAYINKSKQIRQGQSGNNCNGIYFGGKASGLLRATMLFSDGSHDNFVGFNPMPELNIGIQQRISNLFYVDANAFVNYNFDLMEPGLGIKILIGLAIAADDSL